MKKIRLLSLALCLALILGMLTGCGSTEEPAPAEKPVAKEEAAPSQDASEPEFVLKAGHVLSETGAYHIGLQAMSDYMYEKSGGRIMLEIYPSSQLGNERELFEGTQLGTVDIACGATSVLSNFDPSFTIFELPYLFDDRDHAFAVLDSEFGQSKLAALEQYDMVGLCYYDTGFFEVINSNRPVNSLADAKGLQIRTVESATFLATMESLGINPNPMAWTDAYVAMQNGTIDGTCNPIGPIYNTGVYEICQNLCIAEAIYDPICVVISKATWDSLPADLQEIVREAAAESVKVEREVNVGNEQALLEEMQSKGLKVTYVDKAEYKAATESVYEQFVPSIVSQEDIDAVRAVSK